MAKDNFSAQAKDYALFRPTFPDALYEFIVRHVPSRELAWDVATGNGQSAVRLKNYFTKVIATDFSNSQLGHATLIDGVEYRNETAEQSSLNDHSTDLVNISQAIHWFEFKGFYDEVKRVAKPGAVIAAYCYSMFAAADEGINEILRRFYAGSAPYWDAERRFVDDGYATIPFPFDEIESPPFQMEYYWTLEQMVGYIGTWSASRHYIQQHGHEMITPELIDSLKKRWPQQDALRFIFPVHMRIGRIK